jgi:hypothetical protein
MRSTSPAVSGSLRYTPQYTWNASYSSVLTVFSSMAAITSCSRQAGTMMASGSSRRVHRRSRLIGEPAPPITRLRRHAERSQ